MPGPLQISVVARIPHGTELSAEVVMKDEKTTTPADAKATKTPKPLRSFGATLVAGDGAKLWIRAYVLASGSWRSETHHTPAGKGAKRQRGMTSDHATLPDARAAVDALVAQATKAGWAPKKRAAGFKRKADAFSTMPKAGVKK